MKNFKEVTLKTDEFLLINFDSKSANIEKVKYHGRDSKIKTSRYYNFSNEETHINHDDDNINFLDELEIFLKRVSKKGKLRDLKIGIGFKSDPFIPFNNKFDLMRDILRLLKVYKPGQVLVKTHSPLLVTLIVELEPIKDRLVAVIPLETHIDEVSREYLPGLPKPSERLKFARVLKTFGITTVLRASPVLPYGNREKDAKKFAKILVENSDYIQIFPLTDGTFASERKLKSSKLANALSKRKAYEWLRPDSAKCLISAVKDISSKHLESFSSQGEEGDQLDLFAA